MTPIRRLAGLFTLLTQLKFHYEGAGPAPILYFIVAIVLALAIGIETYFQNDRWPVFAVAGVVGASVLALVLMPPASPRSWQRVALAGLIYAAALLTKESGAVLPASVSC